MDCRREVLALLEARRGERISGERIAAALHVTRSAVWKAVAALRAEGYRIEAGTRTGYCLSDADDILSLEGIRPHLNAAARGVPIRILDAPDSTNRAAKELALAGAPHGTTVLADSQTAGRGRAGRRFFSPPGGLYGSVVLRPEAIRFPHPTAVTAFAALAVCAAIEEVSDLRPAIKWVNDICVGGRKVCGILTEALSDLESGALDFTVVGIGINVSAAPADFPPDLRGTAGALFPGERVPGVRNRLAAALLNALLGTPAPDEVALFAAYRGRLLDLGRAVRVTEGERTYSAVVRDIDEAGRLIVEENGMRHALAAGEIRPL